MMLKRVPDRCGTRYDVEFAENRAHVRIHCVLANHEPPRALNIGQTLGEQTKYLDFSPGEIVGITRTPGCYYRFHRSARG